MRVIKGGFLLFTAVMLFLMVSSIEGWLIMTTPISFLGVHPATKRFFSYFITLQVLIFGSLYKRRNVKPMLAFLGLASLILLDIYDMETSSGLHNFFAIIFFLVQPIILFLEYKKKGDSLFPTKTVILSGLMVLTALGILPIPIFEFVAYILLILFL